MRIGLIAEKIFNCTEKSASEKKKNYFTTTSSERLIHLLK